MSTDTRRVDPGIGKPRALDDDEHLWVEMEPDCWVSWFDRFIYTRGRSYTTATLTEKWASVHGLLPFATYQPKEAHRGNR